MEGVTLLFIYTYLFSFSRAFDQTQIAEKFCTFGKKYLDPDVFYEKFIEQIDASGITFIQALFPKDLFPKDLPEEFNWPSCEEVFLDDDFDEYTHRYFYMELKHVIQMALKVGLWYVRDIFDFAELFFSGLDKREEYCSERDVQPFLNKTFQFVMCPLYRIVGNMDFTIKNNTFFTVNDTVTTGRRQIDTTEEVKKFNNMTKGFKIPNETIAFIQDPFMKVREYKNEVWETLRLEQLANATKWVWGKTKKHSGSFSKIIERVKNETQKAKSGIELGTKRIEEIVEGVTYDSPLFFEGFNNPNLISYCKRAQYSINEIHLVFNGSKEYLYESNVAMCGHVWGLFFDGPENWQCFGATCNNNFVFGSANVGLSAENLANLVEEVLKSIIGRDDRDPAEGRLIYFHDGLPASYPYGHKYPFIIYTPMDWELVFEKIEVESSRTFSKYLYSLFRVFLNPYLILPLIFNAWVFWPIVTLIAAVAWIVFTNICGCIVCSRLMVFFGKNSEERNSIIKELIGNKKGLRRFLKTAKGRKNMIYDHDDRIDKLEVEFINLVGTAENFVKDDENYVKNKNL